MSPGRFFSARRMPRVLIFACVYMALSSWHCERAVSPPGSLARGQKCSPWVQASFRLIWVGTSELPDEARGCLLISRGTSLVNRTVAMLKRSGELWGWDGKAFAAEAGLRLPSPKDGDEKLQFWFYAPVGEDVAFSALAQACRNFTPDSYRNCLTSDPRLCLFALAFRPQVAGVAASDIALPSAVEGINTSEGPHCRLFFPGNDNKEIHFATRTPTACACQDGNSFQPVQALSLDEDVQDLALASDGKQLMALTATKLHFFSRTDTSRTFGAARHVFTLPQKGWKVRFDREHRFLAVVMERRLEVWDLTSMQSGQRKVLLTKDADASSYVADAIFRPGVEPTIAVALYSRSEQDAVEVWTFSSNTSRTPKLLGVHRVFGPQALAFDRDGRYLIVGYGIPPGTTAAGARFNVIPLKGQGEETILQPSKHFFTKLAHTSVTSIRVSPANDYLLIGSGPDLLSLRNLVTTLPKGDHGQIEIKSTTPLSEQSGALLLPGQVYAHEAYTQEIAFSAGGQLLATLGLAGADGSHQIHLWKSQARFPFFGYVSSFVPPKGTRGLAFGPGCASLYAGARQSPSLPVWQSCQ